MPVSLNKKKEFIDFGKLANPEMKEKYFIDVKNKCEILSMETDAQEEAVPVCLAVLCVGQSWTLAGTGCTQHAQLPLGSC